MRTADQGTGRNRKMIVITADLMMLTMEAERWEPSRYSASGQVKTSIQVYKAEPGNGTPSILIGEFPDVSAVYFYDDVELNKPDE